MERSPNTNSSLARAPARLGTVPVDGAQGHPAGICGGVSLVPDCSEVPSGL